MSTQTQDACFRCLKDCTPLANLTADGSTPPASFICVGANHPASRTVKQDRFTLAVSNGFDEKQMQEVALLGGDEPT